MNPDPTLTRRTALLAGGAGAGALVLAACSGGSSTSKAQNQGSSDDNTGSGGPAAGGGSGSAGKASGSTANSSGGKALIKLADISVGSSASVKLSDGKPGIVTRTGTDTVVAFSAICTHMGCTVKPKGGKLDCPCHGSVFDARTGKVLGGPAPSPLPSVAVQVEGSNVVAG